MSGYALGLIETKGLVGAIEACDAAAKSAQVTIMSAEVTDGGFVSLKIEGDLAAVRVAVETGAQAAERIGELIAAHVIPRPDEGLDMMRAPIRFLHKDDSGKVADSRPPVTPTHTSTPPPPRPPVVRPKASPEAQAPKPKPTSKPKPDPKPAPPPPDAQAFEASTTSLAELQKMPVVKLRQFARTVANLPIQGRAISMANKTQLIEALKSAMNLE